MKRPALMLATAVAAGALVAAAAARLHVPHSVALSFDRTTRLACTVAEPGTQDDQTSAFACLTDNGDALSVRAPGAMPPPGTRLLLRGRIEPFDAPRNPGEPDQRALQRERGFDARMSAHVLATLPREKPSLRVLLAQWHAWALARLRERLAEPGAAIVAGELWGEREAIAPDLRAEFQETGTVHVLVTAGLHLGVVAAVAYGLLALLTLPRAWNCVLTIAAIWAYAVFSGLHLPSERAAAMISFALLAQACGASARSWNAYAAAMVAVAVLAPQSVGSVSFLLSFSCVGAILLLADPIAAHLERTAIPHALREAVALAISTQIGTWPLTAAIFLLAAPYAVLANLLVVPVVPLTMILGAAQLLLTPVPALAQAAANLDGWALAWIVGVVRAIAALPGAHLALTPPPWWAIAAYDALIVCAAYCMKRSARTPALACVCVAFALVLWPPIIPDERLRITAVDVGQADCLVIRTPLGETILVDAGGRLERGPLGASSAERVGELTVVPYLLRAGVHRIDALILSHPHGDHAGGAPVVLRNLPVTEFADGGQRYGGAAYNDALQTARSEHVPMRYPRAGDVWHTADGITLRFIGPSLPFIESNNTINDNSIAFVLQYKHFRMLFTGDAGVAAEQRFLNEGIDLHADVLKVGHHGSAYSSSPAFIQAVHPRYAIISVGRHNLFGHPAPSTIETLQRFGVRVFRTDENGATTVVTNGRNETFSTMLPYGEKWVYAAGLWYVRLCRT